MKKKELFKRDKQPAKQEHNIINHEYTFNKVTCSREGCFGPTSFHGLAPCVVHSHHMLFSEDYNPVSGGYILLSEGFFLDYYTPFLEDCNNQGCTSS